MLARWVRAVVALVVAVVVFFGCLWVFRYFGWSWLPSAEADRWVVAAAFATLVGTSVFLLLGPWVEGERPEVGEEGIGGPAEPGPPAGGGDRIEVHGPFNGPTVIKGTQANYGPDGRRGSR